MKKIYILTAVFALLTLSLNAQQLKVDENGNVYQPKARTGKVKAPNRAIQTITVCDANTTTSQYVPFYGYYHDIAGTTVQMIYPASMLSAMNGGTISSVKFYSSTGTQFSGGLCTVTMGLTDATSISSTMTLSGTTVSTTFVPSTGMTEIELTFNPGLVYTPGKNLIIQTVVTTYGTCDPYSGTRTEFVGCTQNNNCSYNNKSNTTPSFLPKATFGYEAASTDPTIYATPNSVNLSANPGATATETVAVTGSNLTTGITATVSGQDASFVSVSPASLGSTGGNLTVTYSPSAVGTHNATITLSSTGADPVTITLNGSCVQEKTICDGTNQNGYLPVYGNYNENYQINQMIYPANELTDLVGKKLTSMTFYATAELDAKLGDDTWTVKLGTTDQTTFASSISNVSRIVPSDVQTVYEDLLTTGSDKLTITFDAPFEYNGGNLLVDFEETPLVSTYKDTYFYGVTQESYTAFNTHSSNNQTTNGIYPNGYNSGVRLFLPKVTFAYEENAPRHDLAISLSEPEAVVAGETATVTATVTNTGNQTESGYTVTITAGGNTILTQTVNENLAPGATMEFTATYATTAAEGGTTVSIAANVACTGDTDNTNDNATASLQVTAQVHDLGIALSAPASIVGDNTATVTATVTNNGNMPETGYTVTITAGGTTILTQTVNESLAAGASATFTATYATTASQGGTTVSLTANVTCTGDTEASNDNATASMNIVSMPPPENVQATGGDQTGSMTWDAPSNLPTISVTEDFENSTVFPPFSAGGITATQNTGAFGEWTLYDATGGCVVYGSKEINYDHEGEPHAWFVFKPSEATADEDYPDAVPHASHSGDQYLESICPTSSSTAAGLSDHWLISPELSGNAQEIIFYDSELTTAWGDETYEIWVSTTNNTAPSSFTKLGDYTTDYATWQERRVQLPAGTKYFAIRHTSNDIFGLLVDDFTYEVLLEPESYNIYLDGVLVDNVDASTFNYTFNSVSYGNHQCAVSAVYPNGMESVAVPATFTSSQPPTIAISPATQTISDDAAGTVTVTGSNINGNISVTADNDWSLNPNSLSNTGGNVDVTYTGRALSASTTVTATADNNVTATATVDYVADLYIVGDYGTGWDFNNGTHMTNNNGNYTATITVNANSYIVFARVLGNNSPWGTRDVFGPVSNGNWYMTGNSASGDLNLNDSKCIYFQDAGTYYVTVNANNGTFTITRQVEGKTATPTISYTLSDDGEHVIITATGDGTVTLNVPGYDSVSDNDGEVSITVPCGVVSNTINVTATAEESGKEESDPATAQVSIPAGSGWIEMDGTYNNIADLLSFEKGEEEIMLIDQFVAETLDNTHPDHYTYTLRESHFGEQTSNPVTIPVYKTSSTMQGLYTKTQVDNDTLMQMKANVINTEMDYNVNPDRNVMYYSLYRGDVNEVYPEITADSRISQLQKFDEMDANQQVQYYMFENHQTGVAPRYDHVGNEMVERLDTTWAYANPGDTLSYVPVIWTSGLYTARGDGKNNSYGSDIKREKMGDVHATYGGQLSDGPYGTYTYNNTMYRICHPVINITGIAPVTRISKDGDVSTYVPYMYRAWSDTEGMRDFKLVSGQGFEDAGAIIGPKLLGTEVTSNTDCHIGGVWDSGKKPWAFAIPDGTTPHFVVRFYYKKMVTEGQSNGTMLTLGNGEGEEYFIAEGEGDGNDMQTGIAEMIDGAEPIDVTYVNSLGMQSNKPFSGVNIVVTRYSDGSTSIVKVMY